MWICSLVIILPISLPLSANVWCGNNLMFFFLKNTSRLERREIELGMMMWTFRRYLHVLLQVIFKISPLGTCRQESIVVTCSQMRKKNNIDNNDVAVQRGIDRGIPICSSLTDSGRSRFH